MATIGTEAVPRPASPWAVQALVGLALTAALVTAAYFLVDEPVMAFVRHHELYRSRFLKWLTRPPEAFVLLSPPVLLAGLLRRWFNPWTRVEKVAVAAAVSTLLTALAVLVLKIAFGRSADGFHPFHFGVAYWALPSGHTACTLSATTVAEAASPRLRPFWWALAAIVAAALVGLTYHFVGDVVAGAFVGWAVGRTVARRFEIEAEMSAR
jgi:membrane-associated phospholipid phosphatase